VKKNAQQMFAILSHTTDIKHICINKVRKTSAKDMSAVIWDATILL
jgi:hypothetical protein